MKKTSFTKTAALTGVLFAALSATSVCAQESSPSIKKVDGPSGQQKIIASPEFKEDGIYCGDKILRFSKTGAMNILSSGVPIANLYMLYYDKDFNISNKAEGEKFLKIDSVKIDKNTKEYTVKGIIPLSISNVNVKGEYLQKVKLLDNGKIEIKCNYIIPPEREKMIKDTLYFISLPNPVGLRNAFKDKESSYNFPKEKTFGFFKTKSPDRLEFAPDNLKDNFIVEPVKFEILLADTREEDCAFRLKTLENEIVFTLDLMTQNQAVK
jgi:hypothetical protein